MSKMIVALDLETTGFDTVKDAIIEIALIKIDTKTFKTVDTYTTFVNPEQDIPELITNITNIHEKDVEDAPVFSHIRQEVQDFIGGNPILGHNTNFDKGFLIANGVSLEKNLVLDTFFLANFLLWDIKSLNLGFIADHLGVDITAEHRAIYDTEATICVYKELISILQKQTSEKQQIFRYITDISQDKQGMFYRENYLEKTPKISQEKLTQYIVSTIGNNKTSQKIEQNYDAEPHKIDTIFSQLSGFETRENQRKMAHTVYDSLTKSKKSVIEAPTGIGKTFAYLIPSILFSVELGEQVFISTSTKTLQDQIYFKDLEFLAQNIGVDFSFTKLKGKKNYLGVYALFEFLDSQESFSSASTCFSLKILFWLLQTSSGELDDLDFYGEEFTLLKEINAALPFTFHNDNPYLNSEFVVRARERAKKSNIVIVNNHILFQDIVSEGRLLGKVKNLILDEAHNLEDVVTQSLKKGFSLPLIEKTFTELERNLHKQGHSFTEISYKKEIIVFDITTLLDTLSLYLFSKVSRDSKYKNILLKSDFFDLYKDAVLLASKLQKNIKELLVMLKDFPETDQLLLGREVSFFGEITDILSSVFTSPEKFSQIIPIINHRDNYGIILEYTVLNPGQFLDSHLWKALDTCVLTSATLRIENTYEYVTSILHLKDFDFYTLETDFHYNNQALLFIPNDLGSIKNNTPQILEFLKELFPIVGGRTLVLFTAFSMIQQCYLGLNQYLKEKNIHLLAQSIGGSKQKQIDFFKKHSQESIMIGTDSFWEGIDIPGDDLKYLIIHKVPFMVPSDPIFQARSTLFVDSFRQYSIPKSILKLKQGFGRLIRSKTDTGIVIFLDDRIFSTNWGNVLFDAFPENIRIKTAPATNLLSVIQK